MVKHPADRRKMRFESAVFFFLRRKGLAYYETTTKGVLEMEDCMFLGSAFTRGIVSRIIERTLRKKLGADVEFSLEQFRVTFDRTGKAYAHVDADISMDGESLVKLLKDRGLD